MHGHRGPPDVGAEDFDSPVDGDNRCRASQPPRPPVGVGHRDGTAGYLLVGEDVREHGYRWACNLR
jgi:hypothetical protein